MMNILNGGAHADSSVDFQEFMVMPLGFTSFHDGLRAGVEIFHSLKQHPEEEGLLDGRRRRGRLRAEPQVQQGSARRRHGGHREGRLHARASNVFIAMDAAASELWDDEKKMYVFKKSGEASRTSEQMVDLWDEWTKNYPICSLEDGLAEQATGTAGPCSPSATRRSGCSWWATTSSSPTRPSSRKASARASATPS